MRPNLQEVDLVAQNTALYVAQSQAPLSTCSAWTAAQWLRAIVGKPTEPLGRCVVSSPRVRNSAKYVPQLSASDRDFTIGHIPSRFAIYLRYWPYTFTVCDILRAWNPKKGGDHSSE